MIFGLRFYKAPVKLSLVFCQSKCVKIQFQLTTSVEINPCSIQIELYIFQQGVGKKNRNIVNVAVVRDTTIGHAYINGKKSSVILRMGIEDWEE